MALRKTSTVNSRGFTLIEMLIVIGLITVLGSMTLFIDLNSYRGDAFRAERTTIVTLMQQARADALNNIGQEPHGLALFPADYTKGYVLFTGASYALRNTALDQRFESAYEITLGAGSPSEVVFEQLNGDANYTGTVNLVDSQRNMTTDITLNHEGAISW